MQEDFLQFLWKSGNFRSDSLQTTDGRSITIINRGHHNRDAGPDFLEAVIRIGDTTWAGNVEVHVRASEWNQHKHHTDKAYDNTILHVVYRHDTDVQRTDGSIVPSLQLSDRILPDTVLNYRRLMENLDEIPCRGSIGQVPDHVRYQALERALVGRLEQKTTRVEELLKQNTGDWQQVLWILFMRNMGMKVNAVPMEQLARIIPCQMLMRYADRPDQAEALLFGAAGMLDGRYSDEYPVKLQREFRMLKEKHSILPMGIKAWRFMRLRPMNFPTLRISQAAAIALAGAVDFSNLTGSDDLGAVLKMLHLPANDYWNCHYRFDIPSPAVSKQLGKDGAENIIINTLVPVLFANGRYRGIPELEDRALQWLSACETEDNKVVRRWKDLGMKSANAADSQGLIELYNHHCLQRRCMDCPIGRELLIRPATQP